MHVHIATAGQAVEPVVKAFNAIPGIDKVYLLCSAPFRESAMHLESFFQAAMVPVETRYVDGFDFQGMVDAIYAIFEREGGKGTDFSINITGGTNLMAASACSTAFFVGARICYVLRSPEKTASEQLIWIPTPSIPDLHRIKGKTREILSYIMERTRDGGAVTSTQIDSDFGYGKQAVSYHVRVLVEEGLVEKVRGMTGDGRVDNRMNALRITGQGRLVASWLSE